MGIENLYPYMLSEANKGRISFNKSRGSLFFNPAKNIWLLKQGLTQHRQRCGYRDL